VRTCGLVNWGWPWMVGWLQMAGGWSTGGGSDGPFYIFIVHFLHFY